MVEFCMFSGAVIKKLATCLIGVVGLIGMPAFAGDMPVKAPRPLPAPAAVSEVLPGPAVTAKGRHRENNGSIKIAKSHHDKSNINIRTTTPPIAKTEAPPSSQLHDESVATPTVAAKTETPPSSQLDDESVIKKAEATVAAKTSDPNSVEFGEVERAVSKNVLGNSIDTVCGYVRDKNSGPKLFLYIVQEDEAYIGGDPIATSQFRSICSITTLGR